MAATTLLTRLPVGRLAAAHPPAAACVWAYPLVGLLVGGVGAALLGSLAALGLPQTLAAIWAIAGTALLTGGLHEDGLADTADGFGGGQTAERKLNIMRDSRIGSYGALALGFSLLLRAGAVAIVPHPALALIVAGVLGRAAMLVPLVLLRPARSTGLAASLGSARPRALAGLALVAPIAIWAPGSTAVTLGLSLALTVVSHHQIGGYSGDVLGAVEQAAECGVLSSFAV